LPENLDDFEVGQFGGGSQAGSTNCTAGSSDSIKPGFSIRFAER
jgi:hypothetical protein